jgi:predicted acylesterase/phospholipase RssA
MIHRAMKKDFERYSEDLHRKTESVIVLQGGGSLGAYECGVYRCLYKNQIKFDVLAGSSIGAVNASIICAAQNAGKDIPKLLEDFWLSLAEDISPPNPFFVSAPFISSDKTAHMDVDADDVMACVGYPFYGIRWSEKNGRHLWDGSLLTNTPMLEVIRRSPQADKKFYIVDVFPRQQKELPSNMIEVWHRARDIVFMDKTDKNIEMLKVNGIYIDLLIKMYEIIKSKNAAFNEDILAKIKEIEPEYDVLVKRIGRSIKDVVRVGRRETLHYLLEDADFSIYRVKKLIAQGEKDAEQTLSRKYDANISAP